MAMSDKDRERNRQTNINPAFNAVARDDFAAMLNSERYLERAPEFETLIARTHEHFWNPDDPDYIDFDIAAPTDLPLIPISQIPERHSAIWDTLDEGQQINFANQTTLMRISGVLHGEQGALSISTGLADMLLDAGAAEYATNQAREEARHVQGFARYLHSRFGEVTPPTETLDRVLNQIVGSNIIYEKLIGMQMVIEGIAMGIFAGLYQEANDPVLRRLAQLVMTDESFHHSFGQIWARLNVPGVGEEIRNELEDYSRDMFEDLLFNLVGADQRRGLYERCGIDPDFAVAAMSEAITDDTRRSFMRDSSNIFRTLIKTLYTGGLITERTMPFYSLWVDMDEIAGEGEWNIGQAIAEEGIAELKQINEGKRSVIRPIAN
jgi:hypothetical protein